MKLSHILSLVAGSAIAGIFASTSPAHALDFNWSFIDTWSSSPGGTVSGTVSGLNIGSNTVTSVTVTSAPGNNGIGTYLTVGSAGNSTWNVNSTGNVTFVSWLGNNASLGSSLFLGYGPGASWVPELRGPSYGYDYGNYSQTSMVFTTAATVPFDIPGGATIPSVGAVLALGAMRKARKSIASKTRLANPVAATVS